METRNPENQETEVPYMRSLSYCVNKFNQQGYKENFQATEEGLQSLETHKKYNPDDVHVVNYFRFEGVSDPADNSILYVIEMADGAKGTLVDAYGAYSDANVEEIMKQVQQIERH